MNSWVLVVMLAGYSGGAAVDSRLVYSDELQCIRAGKALQDAAAQSPANPEVFRAAVRAVCVEGPAGRRWWALW